MEKIEFQIDRPKLDTTLNVVVSLDGITVNGVTSRVELFQGSIYFDVPIPIKGKPYSMVKLKEEELQQIVDAAKELRQRVDEATKRRKRAGIDLGVPF